MKWRSMAVAIPLFTASCGHHAIDLADPSKDQVEQAIQAFNRMTPRLRTGRWEVAVSNGHESTNVDQATADNLRAAARSWNTQAKCRKEAEPIDFYTKTHIEASFRPGCKIATLVADAGAISWTSVCQVAGTQLRDEFEVQLEPEHSIATVHSVDESRNDSNGLELRHEGHFVGGCIGNETPFDPLWVERG